MGPDYVYNSANMQVYAGERHRVLAMLDMRPELKEEGHTVFDSRKNENVPVAEYLVLNGEEKKAKIAGLVRGVSIYAERHDSDENEDYVNQVIDVINKILGDL